MTNPSQTTNEWSIPPQEQSWDDPLLQSLAWLSRYWRKPHSETALRAGLPLSKDGGLTPELFIRAAHRCGLSARLVRRPLRRISPLVLPAVLLLHGQRACLLISMEEATATAEVVFPETGGGREPIPFANLEREYSGSALFVRPAFRFDARSAEISDPQPENWFWGTLRRFLPLYAEVILASLFINLFSLATPLFVKNVYDRVVPNIAMETLWVLGLGVIMVCGFDFLLRLLRGYFLDAAGKQADILIASRLFQHVIGIRMVARPASSGALAKHLQEFEGVRDFFTSITLTTLIDLPFVVLFLVMIGFLGGELVWIPALAVPLVLAIALWLQRPIGVAMRASAKESVQKHALLVEALNGLETVKMQGAEGAVLERWEQCVNQTAASSMAARLPASLALNVALLVQQLAGVGVIIHGVHLIRDGELSMGGLFACSMLTGRAIAPLSQVAALLVRWQQSLISLKTLDTLLDLPLERPAGEPFLRRPELKGEITFRDVTFSYPHQESPTLVNLNLHIAPGERIAFIGRIGSGKSTLLKLILGLYQPNSGHLLLDGVDARQIDPADIRRAIGCVPQETTLFFGTLRENITFGTPFAYDNEILEAARCAGVEEFASRHPRGFDLPIGEQGQGLSGGQRQAVVIARALLGRPPILLFDEPTSAMDNSSEARFKERLARELEGRTLVLVTHRASLLSLVERVVVLEDGRIVADGPRETVLRQLANGQLRIREGGP